MNRKEYMERNHLQYFINTECGRALLNQLHCYEILKKDPPDFVLKTLIGHCSLELTILSYESPLLKLFSALNGVVESVFKKIDQNLDSKYFINLICLENDINKIKIHKSKLVEQVFNIIKGTHNNNCDPETTSFSLGEISVSGKHHNVEFYTDTGVGMRLVYSKNDDSYNFGGTPVFSPICINPTNLIKDLIDKKNKKLSIYKNCYSKCFLLLITDPFITKGCSFEFDDVFFQEHFYSSFDDIFLLELGGRNNIRASKLKNNF